MCSQRIPLTYPRVSIIWLWLIITLTLLPVFTERLVAAARLNNDFDPISYTVGQPFEQNPPAGSHIRIDPSLPTPDDILRIRVSGEWINVCVPHYEAHRIVGNVIRIEAVTTLLGVCLPIELPRSWSFTVEVGPLPIGVYTVEVYLLDSSFPGRPPILYDAASFLVATDRLYLPLFWANTDRLLDHIFKL